MPFRRERSERFEEALAPLAAKRGTAPLPHVHLDRHNVVDDVRPPIRVPLHRLRVAAAVGGPGHERVSTRLLWRLPNVFPQPPGVFHWLVQETDLAPGRATVRADFDFGDLRLARPGGAEDAVLT